MRIFILLCSILLFTNNFLQAQSPTWVWAKNNNVPYGAVGLVTDATGNVYTVGLTFAKRSPSGVLLWSHQLVSPNQDAEATGLTRDAAGNLYLCGYFNATIQLDTISLTSSGRKDIFVAKFNANGNIQWARKAGGPGSSASLPGYIDDVAWSIAVDSIGNCYITGGIHAINNVTVWFDSISIPPGTPSATGRAFIAKYSTAGKIQWVRQISGMDIYDIGLGPQGTYYIAQGTSNVNVSKFNNYGVLSWSKTSSATGGATNYGLCTDKVGNCFITGSFYGRMIFDQDTLNAPANTSNVYLVKYGSNGIVQWARQNKGGRAYGEFVAADNTGNIYLTGELAGTTTFAPGIQVTGAYGSTDIFAAKYNNAGTAQWVVVAGSGGGDYGQAIGALPNGDCYVAGEYTGFSTFGSLYLNNPSTYSFFVAKLSVNPLGIPENKTSTSFQLYPNPATSEVTLSSLDFRNAEVKIYNAAGQQVYDTKVQEQSKLNILTSNWPVGIYLVKLNSGKEMRTEKLIVTR